MDPALRVCGNCRVVVRPAGDGWEHVPEFAEKFTRTVCQQPTPGRIPSGSEVRFGLGRAKSSSRDKLFLKAAIEGLEQPDHVPVTVAVDGSYKLTITHDRVIKPMSWGYLTTTGLYGLGTSIVPGRLVGGRQPTTGTSQDPVRALNAELRAMANALQAIHSDHPITILSDSRSAIDMMVLWREGYDVMPGGYSTDRSDGRESTLARLARRVRESPDRITMRWVPGHSGHPLNEGADALARMARAWATGVLEKDTVAADARRVTLQALTRHAAGALT